MTNAWAASDSVNLVLYICKPLHSSYIHFPVSKDFLWKSENIGVLIPRNGFPLHCTSYCERGFDWSRDKLINPELNIHFVTSQFDTSRSTWESLKETWRSQSELTFLLLFQRIASKIFEIRGVSTYYERSEPVMRFSILQNGVIAESLTFGNRSKSLQVAKCLDLARVVNVFL